MFKKHVNVNVNKQMTSKKYCIRSYFFHVNC